MALEQNTIMNAMEADNKPQVSTQNLFNHLPMILLSLDQGTLNVQNVSDVLKKSYNIPLQETVPPLEPPPKLPFLELIKSNIAPEDQAILVEKDYEEIAKELETMKPEDPPLIKVEMTYTGEIELRFRKLDENKVLMETNPVRDRRDTLTGMYERDVFERRSRRVNNFLLDTNLPEHLKPISKEHPINAFFADANNLKTVNDGPGGHLAGNAYLLGISIALKAAVFGTEPMQGDIALKTFIESPDKNVYKQLFEEIRTPEFWAEYNKAFNNYSNKQNPEISGRTITKMPDAIYRYGGDEYIGFLNSDDIIGFRQRVNSAISYINNAIVRNQNLNGLLPQLSVAIAAARTDGKVASFLSEKPNGEFYFDPNFRFQFQSFHKLINDIDVFMYKHKEMQKLFGDKNHRDLEVPNEWLQLLNTSFIEDLRPLPKDA